MKRVEAPESGKDAGRFGSKTEYTWSHALQENFTWEHQKKVIPDAIEKIVWTSAMYATGTLGYSVLHRLLTGQW